MTFLVTFLTPEECWRPQAETIGVLMDESENALLRAKVPKVVCGARSFKYIYEDTFNPSRLFKLGPIMEDECRGIFITWLKETGRDFILEFEDL